MQITLTAALMTGASLTANRASPMTPGETVIWTAAGSGDGPPYEYLWHVQRNGGAFRLVRTWSADGTYAWTPTETGEYTVAVSGRIAGSNCVHWQAYAQRTFVVAAPR